MKAQRSQPDAAPLGFENTGKWPAAENNRPPCVCVFTWKTCMEENGLDT